VNNLFWSQEKNRLQYCLSEWVIEQERNPSQNMNTKLNAAGFLAVLGLLWAGSAPATPITFYFSGQITGERTQNSVFTGNVGDSFSGSFSYDTTAASTLPPSQFGFYPLISFNVDGHSLNFSNGVDLPDIPGVLVEDGGDPVIPDWIEIRGFYPAATASDPNDNGSVDIRLTDFTGVVFTSSSLPTSLSLDAFTHADVLGPFFGVEGAVPSYDTGIVTELVLIPEPAPLALLSLSLLSACLLAPRPKGWPPKGTEGAKVWTARR